MLRQVEGGGGLKKERVGPRAPPPLRALPLAPGGGVPSPLLRARSAAQLLQHSPLAEIVLFNEHAETAFRPRFFICFPQTRKRRCRRRERGRGGQTLQRNTHKEEPLKTTSRVAWLVRRMFRWQEGGFFFLIQSQGCSSRWKRIVVQRSDVRRSENGFGGKEKREKKGKKVSHN